MSEYAKLEEAIQDAIEWYQKLPEDERPTIKGLAVKHNVPYRRLLARMNGSPSKSSRTATNRALGPAEEHALCLYVIRMEKLFMPVTREQIQTTAQQMLNRAAAANDEVAHQLGEHWVKRLLDRRTDLFVRKSQNLAFERKNSHDELSIRGWFSALRELKEKYGIVESDMHNMDETGFQIGMSGSRWIVTREPKRRVYIPASEDRTLVTVIETISADGTVIPPMLILPGKQILRGWIAESLEDETLFTTSESGFSNDELGLAYIKHFDRQTKKQTKGEWRLLLLDGHGSHRTQEVISYAESQKILMFSFPPHATHFMQPLDVVCFQPLKHYHRKAVVDATQTGCGNFGKIDFLNALHGIRSKAFKSTTIRSAFRKTGLVPFNPEVLLPIDIPFAY